MILDSNNKLRSLFMIGVGGNGMSSIASWYLEQNIPVWGSDRDISGYSNAIEGLKAKGLCIFPQDGSGIEKFLGKYPSGLICVTPAVESHVPDYAESKRLYGDPLLRSDLLAEIFNLQKFKIAVAGTAGKSSVSAMLFYELYKNSLDPSFISGSPVNGFSNGVFGLGPMVIEADESDLSLVKYSDLDCAVLLNLEKEHHDLSVMIDKMVEFLFNVKNDGFIVVNHDSLNVRRVVEKLQKKYDDYKSEKNHMPNIVWFSYGGDDFSEFSLLSENLISKIPWKTSAVIRVGDLRSSFKLPFVPGYAVSNFLPVYAVCHKMNISFKGVSAGASSFPGLSRRFQLEGIASFIPVIHDYAHAPMEIKASIDSAKTLLQEDKKLFVVYQPHGFGPVRFTFDQLVDVFSSFGDNVLLWISPIFYAGGTVKKDISSGDLVESVNQSKACKSSVYFGNSFEDISESIISKARPGDIVLLLGARNINTMSPIILQKLENKSK